MIETRERQEGRAGNALARRSCLEIDVVGFARIKAARRRDAWQQFIKSRPVLEQRHIRLQVGSTQAICEGAFRSPEYPCKGREKRIGTSFDTGPYHLAKFLHAAGEGMLPADHETLEAVGGKFSHAEADPSAHGVTPEAGLFDANRVENGDNIADPVFKSVRPRIVRLVAAPSPRASIRISR